ncbi:hypothetical protein EDC56_3713 [Sinobacterium caligoides]|uniref:Uncharacterized protein n=1 Tax=Sinobacterium caligoides TaxID=933926 RepID=A0A3N2D554_9GAMM|nr:hypothetical protein [Sinobacterium caligoides]ROR94900.1 hypothetical protein EDC56_3713 [Sinobacterium caligoides]
MKRNKIFLGIFTAFGLYVFVSILSQLITAPLSSNNICDRANEKKLVSPDRQLELTLEFRTCTLSGGTTRVVLYELSNPNRSEVLVDVEMKNKAGNYYPVPIQPVWLDAKSLAIYLPKEHISRSNRNDAYGVSIQYHPIGG